MTSAERVLIRVGGIVQGVGFRPFVYRRATAHGLAGRVKNLGDAGVEIILEGPEEQIEAFLTDLRREPPPLASVESVGVEWGTPNGLDAFEIVSSSDASGGTGTIPPDTGMCSACLEDMRDPTSRYAGYWATACVDCGPRFTVIRDLPYDRPRTAMDEFPMCQACQAEYEDPGDRRYHAQAIACPDCGPQLSLLDVPGKTVAEQENAIRETATRLAEGEILAIKGIGGTHLATDATDTDAVTRLRERTGRPAKPFAVMAPSVEAVEEFARVTESGREALSSLRRPIVLVETDEQSPWLAGVAPGLHTLGVMLPYAGLHHRLFEFIDAPLVMTSGNLPGRPMCTTAQAIRERLDHVVDGALVHDRAIVARCDDSVVRFAGGQRHFLRRSRGWVPQPLPRPGDGGAGDVLALGPAFDVTVALGRDDEIVLSQHIGDVDGPETLDFLRDASDHLTEITGATPDLIVCDLHPTFETTAEADRLASQGLAGPIQVQHHHAHAAALLGEHDRERAIVITADGTGYGPDGSVWGGEVLDATLSAASRVGGIDTFKLPGGEAAIDQPARVLADILSDPTTIDDYLVDTGTVTDANGAATVRRQTDQAVNTPETTSAGRFLDAISAMLGVCTERRYQGEPAMRLEATAAEGDPLDISVPYCTRADQRVVDVARLTETLHERSGGSSTSDIAATAQWAMAEGLADIAIEAAQSRDIEAIGFTGGVAYNDAISSHIRDRVAESGVTFLAPDRVPPGDAGVSYGQAVVATARDLG